MRSSLAFVLSGFAWVQLTQAACCRSNKCLKAIVNPLLDGQGVADCSSAFAVTQTVSAITETFTSIITASPAVSTEETTAVETLMETVTERTTASTKTHVVATVTETATVTTRTESRTGTVLVIGRTGTVTQTLSMTVSLPASTVTGSWSMAAVGRRDDGTATTAAAQVPSYAASVCPSRDQYLAACRCAGVARVPTVTVSVAPVSTTIFVDREQSPVVETSTVLSTRVSTVTETIFSIAGRTKALSCGGRLYVSSGNGMDTGAPCLTVSPKLVLV